MNLNKIGKTALTAFFILIVSAISISAATFTVTNTNDSGAGSLRDAITQANANAQADTINFDPAVFNVARTITLTSGEISIASDGVNPGRLVTINGPGAHLLTISGNNASRIFLVGTARNANVVMSGMTLREGNGIGAIGAGGGAIYGFDSALTLNSMVIRNNTGNGAGGAIATNSGKNLVINDSLITENSASRAGGLSISNNGATFTMRNTIISDNIVTADVGAIDVFLGNVDIKNCRITGNIARSVNSSGTVVGGRIGGMNFFQATVLDISDTVISNNVGGTGIGGISVNAANAILRRVTISNNTANFGQAGGIALGTDGVITIIDSTISNNIVGVIAGSGNSEGGGIYISFSDGVYKIINTTVSGNSAVRGGGIVNDNNSPTTPTQLINSTVVNNSALGADGRGGGGIISGSTLRGGFPGEGDRIMLQNSIVANNTAPTGPDLQNLFISNGYNIIGNTTGSGASPANTGDQFNVNPNVAALADNGGSTLTHALLTGSPAINAGSNALAVDQNGFALRFDQRGGCYNRRVGGTADIGAFEFGAVQISGKNASFDLDGDCRTDVGIFRPGPGEWWYLRSSDGGNRAFSFGQSTDKVVVADYTGDGKSDIAFFRPSSGEWFVLRSEDSSFYSFPFGGNGDIPTPADFDGDGKADPAIFRPSNQTWYINRSSDMGTTITTFGINGDLPVAADYDGDGKADIGIYRPSNGQWWLNRTTAGLIVTTFGTSTDKTVQADYTGDGKADVAFFRPQTREWFVLRSEDFSFYSGPFGALGDIPSPGDYDGDGKTDFAIFRPSNSTWFIQQSTSGFTAITFGASGDVPIPNAYVR